MIEIGFCLSTFGTRYERLRETAQLIDELGFASLHVWDHYVSWPESHQSVLEAWTTLAALADVTHHVRIGPMVANNLNRHPGRLAKVASTLHEISSGRCDLAIGSGSGGPEHESFGLHVGNAAERIERFAEALQIIPALWTGEPVTFHGTYYELNDAIAAPRQDPPPRLIASASLPQTARLAGQFADGVNFSWFHHERLTLLFTALDEGLNESGRRRADFDISLHVRWHNLQPDHGQALENWEGLGFTRVIIYVEELFPINEITELAQFVLK